MRSFKPMKGDDAVLDKLVFPYMVTPKIDGHRCLIKDGVALTSALKPFPNPFVQGYFSHDAWDGLDGELTVGPPNAPDVFARTSSGVRRKEGTPDFTLHAFDLWSIEADARTRYERLKLKFGGVDQGVRVQVLPMYFVEGIHELMVVERQLLEKGYEGVMLRHPESPYKYGRATVNENYLLKLKRFAEAEAEIIGFVEQQKNNNVASVSELGRTKRSSAKTGKTGKDTLGALKVRGINGKYSGVEFEIGTGMDDDLRQRIWHSQDRHLGAVVTFKYQDIGTYEKPRIPVFKGFRDPDEVDRGR